MKLRLVLRVVGVAEVDAQIGDLNARVVQHEASDPVWCRTWRVVNPKPPSPVQSPGKCSVNRAMVHAL
jgi:hypothetical protein